MIFATALFLFVSVFLTIYFVVRYIQYGSFFPSHGGNSGSSPSQHGGRVQKTDVRVGTFTTKAGTVTVPTPGITPHLVKFYDFGSVASTKTSTDSRNLPQGFSVGYADRTQNKQQCMQNGVSGDSMNTAGRFASAKHCIGYRFQGRNNLMGVNSAKVTQWKGQAFSVSSDAHYRDSLVLFVAYGQPAANTAVPSGNNNNNNNADAHTGLVSKTGVLKLTSASKLTLKTDFVPHTVVFHVQPHYVHEDMNARTNGDRFAATYDNQDGASVGYSTILTADGQPQHQFVSNCSDGANTNRTYQYASDQNSIGYAYVDQNGHVRDKTLGHAAGWSSKGVDVVITQLAEPMYVMYTVYGNARSAAYGEGVHCGDVLLTKTGQTEVRGLPVTPEQLTFEIKADITSRNLNSQSGHNTQDMASVHGNGFGFATNHNGRVVQRATACSSSGSSTNRSAYFASSQDCAVMKYVDQNGRTLHDGLTKVALHAFTEDGFVLHVEALAQSQPSLLMFCAHGTPNRRNAQKNTSA